jgi:hypothetical protein
VDYVYGTAESTEGKLWVVGRDPKLFDFFLPERWRRTPQTRLSDEGQVFRTQTKDGINLVWKVSSVGERPDPEGELRSGVEEIGINSPFEEVAIALELQQAGYPTILPRAIYATGEQTEPGDFLWDERRLYTHAAFTTPDGAPVLQPDHDYITVWGYWSGIEPERLEELDPSLRGLNVAQGCELGLLTTAERAHLIEREKEKLRQVGFECRGLKDRYLLLCFEPGGALKCDGFGHPVVRLCNFEFIRSTDGRAFRR